MTQQPPTTRAFLDQEQARYSGDDYEILTTADVPFDRFPPYLAGGPTRVALGGWSVSKLIPSSLGLSEPGSVTLRAYRIGPDGVRVQHDLDQTTYDTPEDADCAAYAAGLTGFMVYDGYRETLGLPPRQQDATGGRP